MASGAAGFTGPDIPAEDDLYKCVHCGFCLQACPTYVETGLETESPRGRIALMKAVREGRIGITPAVLGHWDLCIQCRACEAACPSGVPYGRLIEATFAQARGHRSLSWPARLAERVALRHLITHQGRLEALARLLWLYRRLGLRWLVKKSRLVRLLSRWLDELEGSLPAIPGRLFRARGQVIPAQGTRSRRVAMLSGCVMPLMHGPQMDAVTRVLARNGCEVVVPKGQVCCGAINTHMGDLDAAREMARRNVDAFGAEDVDAIVVASAGCGARMKAYGDLLRDDSAYRERATRLAEAVQDIHEVLAGLPINPSARPLDRKVTYQDPCHLAHAQRVTRQPRELLSAIPGLELVEMAASSRCCGAGGTYTITQRDFSLRLLDNKMRAIEATGADIVATANPGCLVQLQYGASRSGLSLQVKYVTDLLDEAYETNRRDPEIE